MENTIYVGLTKQIALKNKMDIVANNIANMSTPGYRAQNMVFTEFIEKPPRSPDTPPQDPLSMVLNYGHYQNTAPGPLEMTGNQLDVAVQGPGYLGVQTEGGEIMYTRAGNFQINAEGTLVTGTGLPVANEGGAPIVIPDDAREIAIGEDGSVATEEGEIARLMVVEFDNVQELEAVGGGLYKSEAPGIPAEATRVLQGMLEGSNVNPVIEMTRMIDTARAYQSTQRMLQSEHERQRTMIQRLVGSR